MATHHEYRSALRFLNIERQFFFLAAVAKCLPPGENVWPL